MPRPRGYELEVTTVATNIDNGHIVIDRCTLTRAYPYIDYQSHMPEMHCLMSKLCTTLATSACAFNRETYSLRAVLRTLTCA